MRSFLIAILALSVLLCQSQNTIPIKTQKTNINANLEDVSWIQGHWRGEAFGGITEEIWSPPLGDSMMFSFKLVSEGKVVFYELGGIRQIDDTLLFQLKHFGNDFKGWEEKAETIDAKLVKINGNRVYFEGFTFEKISDTEMAIYVLIENKGKTEEVKFTYNRF